MLSKSIFTAVFATLAMTIPAEATWCKYYTDSQCQQNANDKTEFDCANLNSFASAGRYVQCHKTPSNRKSCIVSRCTDRTCANILSQANISPGNGFSKCIDLQGPGPWYEQKFA